MAPGTGASISQDQRLRGPARALLVIDEPVLAGIVKLVLNHGHYDARVAPTIGEASTLVDVRGEGSSGLAFNQIREVPRTG